MRLGNLLFQRRQREVLETNLGQGQVEQLHVALRRLIPVKIGRRTKRHYTMRTYNHALYWLKGYVDAERLDLNSFPSDKKHYEIVLIEAVDGTQADVVFRLQTAGLNGWTEYGVEVRKVGDYFACRE